MMSSAHMPPVAAQDGAPMLPGAHTSGIRKRERKSTMGRRVRNSKVMAIALALGLANSCIAAGVPGLIPKPVSMEVGSGTFELGATTSLTAGRGAEKEAQELAAALRMATGY